MRDQLDEEGQKHYDEVMREKALKNLLQNLRSVIGIVVWSAKYPRRVKIRKKTVEWTDEQKAAIKARFRMLDVFEDRARVAYENRDIIAMRKVKNELKTYLSKNPI